MHFVFLSISPLNIFCFIVLSYYKPIGASPGRDYEDGISMKNLVLNILWCRVGNYIEKGGECSAGYGLIERF